MASTRKTPDSSGPKKPRRPPAATPEARENQLISLAMDTAERQMREGTASSQVVTHYLKLGSTSERLAQERMLREIDLMEKKAEAMESAKRIEALYDEAIAAMRSYGGDVPEDRHDD